MNATKNYFPVDSLPNIIRNAVYEMERNTHFPMPMIAASALSAATLACQNAIDVKPPVGEKMPCTLFFLTLAESGEGKSPVDKYFNKYIREFEEKINCEFKNDLAKKSARNETWNMELDTLKRCVKNNRKKRHTESDLETIDILDTELKTLEQKLKIHIENEPKNSFEISLLKSNITVPKLVKDLHDKWPSVCLHSDEGDSLFRGNALKDLGLLNQLYDGGVVELDRVSYAENLGSGTLVKRRFLVPDRRSAGRDVEAPAETSCKASRHAVKSFGAEI